MTTPYERLLHAMQSGVAAEIGRGHTKSVEPKHLRVGINAAMSDQAGLVRLLIAKGLFTEEEYVAAITEEMGREVKRYEVRLSEMLNAKITLG